jgi:integrator complex subunit 2
VIASELFDPPVYQEKICDILCVALAELPALLNISEVAESLLHVRFGPWIICRLVANVPDSFKEGTLQCVCYLVLTKIPLLQSAQA